MSVSRTVQKYLSKNPIPDWVDCAGASSLASRWEAKSASEVPPGAVVIPVCAENTLIAKTLSSLRRAMNRAGWNIPVLLVINDFPGEPEEFRAENQTLLHSLRNQDGAFDGGLEVGKSLFFLTYNLPETAQRKAGVGLARKIGMDYLLHVWETLAVDDNILFSLDGDTQVDESYFQAALARFAASPEAGGIIFDFEHDLTGLTLAHQEAMIAYEKFLKQYAAKLQAAGSIFGFWTIGSAFAVRAGAYAAVHGMRIRQGGEDFYFLQALRKYAPLEVLFGVWVHPSPRLSERVPFGTGPALRKRLSGETSMAFPYPDQAFAEIHRVFSCVETLAETSLRDLSEELPQGVLRDWLTAHGFCQDWRNVCDNTACKPGAEILLRRAFQHYFDGFRILKFLHDFPESPSEVRQEAPGMEKKGEKK